MKITFSRLEFPRLTCSTTAEITASADWTAGTPPMPLPRAGKARDDSLCFSASASVARVAAEILAGSAFRSLPMVTAWMTWVGGKVAGDGEDRLSDLDRALAQCVFLDHESALALQRTGHARAHQELVVGRVHHRVHLGVRDVAPLDHDRRLADLALHGRDPVRLASSAFTASHARSRSSIDASVTDRPPALISTSTFPNRLVNFSEERRRHSSASSPRSRATLTIENSRSPSSSATRSSMPLSSASPTSRISSWSFAQASCQRVQSNPTRAAFACSR